MMTRRAFVAAGAAALAADWRVWAADEGLPAYYGDYLAKVAGKVAALKRECCDGFWFLTDLHIPSNRCVSGKLLARLAEETGIGKVLCGGDHVEAFGGKDSIDRTIVDYKEKWVRTIERAGGEFLPAKGNHDFTIRKSMQVKEGFTYSNREARDILMDTDAVRKRAVVNPDDPEACYYYVDEPNAKIRYIVADTSDRVASDRTYWAVEYGMGDRQLVWLAEKALLGMPQDWDAVVMYHIPAVPLVSCENRGLQATARWRRLLEAYQNRRRVTMDEKTFDFGKARGRILMNLTGHEHAERQTYLNGLWHFTEPCDAAYGDYINGSAPWCPGLPKKEKGTVFEQTFAAIQINSRKRTLHFTRFGGGGDRMVHLAQRSVMMGTKPAFAVTRLRGEIVWGCYDAGRLGKRPDPGNRWCSLYTYYNEMAVISRAGLFEPKKPGEVVVVAMNEAGDKEIFPVHIVG
jgi:hypothetical protein